MKLSELIQELPDARRLDPGDPEVTGVTCDSRRVAPGHLFAAIPGTRSDGHRFVGAAARAGARACLLGRAVPAPGAVRVLTDDPERALGRVASAFWGHPSRRLRVVGITGTNGKTTTAYLLQHLLGAAGLPCGRIGTVGYAFPSGEEPASLTTPDAPALQQALGRMVSEGAEAVVMEVSSHALDRQRVEGCRFACTAFTNLSQDHLDYHGTMEEYFRAKALLFLRYAPDAPAVVSAEDPWGGRLARELGDRAVTYGTRQGVVQVRVDRMGPSGSRGRVRWPGGEAPLRIPLPGAFNARNAACALAVVLALGLDVGAAAEALAGAPAVPGRMEAIPSRLGFAVYVDYAHTPDALDRMLEAVGAITPGRVITVFGCGGDRDRGKRPLMGAAAARRSHALVLTADNSRSEPTERILDEIEAGLPGGWARADRPGDLARSDRAYARVPDRAEAIRWAVAAAGPGDAVVVAGKGHEATQTLGDRVLPFDDRRVAAAALAERERAA